MGKSLIAYLIAETLKWNGIRGTVIDDEIAWMDPNKDKQFVKDTIIKTSGDFDVEIETVQINRKCIGI